MVVGVRYRDGQSAAKAHAIFRTLDSNSVVAISVHVAALPAWVRTHEFWSCPLRSNNDHFVLARQMTPRANSGYSTTLHIISCARDQNWGPTYLRRLMSDCPCSGNSSVGVIWPTSMPGVTDVLMYFISPAANWNVTAFSTSVAVVTAYFPGGRST